MADLYAIYQELGLGGIVPHALRTGSHGWKMLIDKIKQGAPLYGLQTVTTEAPYIIVKDGEYQALFFSSEEAAARKADELAMQKYRVQIQPLPDGQERKATLAHLYSYGPSALWLDESLSISVEMLDVELPDYDGLPNEDRMLRNRMLNGATFYYLQQIAAGYGNIEAEQEWARRMRHGHFLMAVEEAEYNTCLPLSITMKDGKNAALIYTDWKQMALSIDLKEHPTGFLVSFEDLYQILNTNDNAVLLLNAATSNLIINQTMMEAIRETASGIVSANTADLVASMSKKPSGIQYDQVSEEDWDKVDPTPDWLR